MILAIKRTYDRLGHIERKIRTAGFFKIDYKFGSDGYATSSGSFTWITSLIIEPSTHLARLQLLLLL